VESDMHKVNGHDIPDLYDIFNGSLDPFLAKWKVSKLIELLETLTVRRDNLLAALTEMVKVEPSYSDDQGYRSCVYCGEWIDRESRGEGKGITHEDDCPWMRAKKLLEEGE
jgi:hypothetical protein